jgi:hypothetical protein
VILVGELSLWVALLMAVWAATVSFAGGQMRRADLIESGERAIYATLAMVILASLGLWTALLTHDFSIRYVASYTSANLPKVYTITAFWGGQSGSLLFWALILAGYSALALWTNRTRNRELMPYVSGTLALVLVFFLATICLGSNPFERLAFIPVDGRGLNPQLQNPGMAILGMGSGRERVIAPMAREHRVPAFDHGAGKAGDAPQVERYACRVGVSALDIRDLHHAQRRDLERPFIRAVAGREVVRGIPDFRDRRHGVSRVDSLAGSQVDGRAGEHGQP